MEGEYSDKLLCQICLEPHNNHIAEVSTVQRIEPSVLHVIQEGGHFLKYRKVYHFANFHYIFT